MQLNEGNSTLKIKKIELESDFLEKYEDRLLLLSKGVYLVIKNITNASITLAKNVRLWERAPPKLYRTFSSDHTQKLTNLMNPVPLSRQQNVSEVFTITNALSGYPVSLANKTMINLSPENFEFSINENTKYLWDGINSKRLLTDGGTNARSILKTMAKFSSAPKSDLEYAGITYVNQSFLYNLLQRTFPIVILNTQLRTYIASSCRFFKKYWAIVSSTIASPRSPIDLEYISELTNNPHRLLSKEAILNIAKIFRTFESEESGILVMKEKCRNMMKFLFETTCLSYILFEFAVSIALKKNNPNCILATGDDPSKFDDASKMILSILCNAEIQSLTPASPEIPLTTDILDEYTKDEEVATTDAVTKSVCGPLLEKIGINGPIFHARSFRYADDKPDIIRPVQVQVTAHSPVPVFLLVCYGALFSPLQIKMYKAPPLLTIQSPWTEFCTVCANSTTSDEVPQNLFTEPAR